MLRTGGTQIIKWTAEGAGKGRKDSAEYSRKSCVGNGEGAGSEDRVYRDVRHTSVAGDMMVSRRVYGIAVNQGDKSILPVGAELAVIIKPHSKLVVK